MQGSPSRAPLLASVQVSVSDLGTTEAFYSGILELPVSRALTSPGAPQHLVLEQEGARLIFVEERDVIRSHRFLEEFLDSMRGVGITFHYKVERIEEIYDALLEEDAEIVYPLREHPYRVKELWCRDPDGYLLVLYEEKEGG